MVLLPHKYWWGKFARGHPETPLVDADRTWNGLVYGTLYHLSQDTSIKNGANHSETAKLDIYSQWTLNTFFGVKVAHIFFGQEIDSMTWDWDLLKLGVIRLNASHSQTTWKRFTNHGPPLGFSGLAIWLELFSCVFYGKIWETHLYLLYIDICNIWLKSMAISGTDLLEVPNIYKAYVREYPYKIWPKKWY